MRRICCVYLLWVFSNESAPALHLVESWQLHHRAKLTSLCVAEAKVQADTASVTQIIAQLPSCCLQVVEETEGHSKQHVGDAQNDRHLHLE